MSLVHDGICFLSAFHYERAPLEEKVVIVPIMTYERSILANSEKYSGLDIHQATISVAVMDPRGKITGVLTMLQQRIYFNCQSDHNLSLAGFRLRDD